MNKHYPLLAIALLAACDAARMPSTELASEEGAAGEFERGPHNGRLLVDGSFALEIAIYEAGVPPEFHVWVTEGGSAVAPNAVDLTVELGRLGGETNRIDFTPQTDFLRGNAVVHEPHSFDVTIAARHAGREHRFSYASYEGRTTIATEVARAAGVTTSTAAPGTISDELVLYGAVAPDSTRVRSVEARFPGIIRSVARNVGDTVRAGEPLATIESNESLQTYTLAAPIGGTITARHAAAGERADNESLFEIADFSTVWAELDVFARDRPRLSTGLPVVVTTESGDTAMSTIAYLAPVGDRASQRVTARVVLDNATGRWTPGQFVEGRVTVATIPVPLAVPLAALQRFRDFEVVFAQVGETYEVRMLELGRRDTRYVEVLGGLEPGTVYVTDNSYLIKADIEKSGASHDH